MLRLTTICLILSVVVFSVTAKAGPLACGLAQTIYSSLTFNEVELIARNHNVGLYRGGVTTLNPFVTIADDAYLGIDREGRLLNVIQLEDRVIAFVLSGERKMRDFFFRPDGVLLAVDQDGHILEFRWSDWNRSETRSLVQRSAIRFGLSVCHVGAILAIYAHYTATPITSLEIPLTFGLGAVSAALIEGFRTLAEYGVQNELTDGLTATGFSVPQYSRSEPIRSASGEIVDYQLRGVGSPSPTFLSHSGRLGPRAENQSFASRCEYALLARGIPPQNYEP